MFNSVGRLFRFGLAIGMACAGHPQSDPPAPLRAFEVASVKPASRDTALPANSPYALGRPQISERRVEFHSSSLKNLVGFAYKIPSDRVTGPRWMEEDRFDLMATFPEGASRDQVPQMLLALLNERFKLVSHRTEKPVSVYALKVASGGITLRESDPSDPAKSTCTRGACEGFQCRKISMQGLASWMSFPSWQRMAGLTLPVVDLTGLKGSYDFDLAVVWEAGPAEQVPLPANCAGGSGSVFKAVKALGLSLEPVKQMQEYVVVDSALRVPIAN